MTILSINWGNVGIQVFYLIFSLSILVILHEFGHYLAARAFGIKVEKFYLFFDAWGVKLFSFNPINYVNHSIKLLYRKHSRNIKS